MASNVLKINKMRECAGRIETINNDLDTLLREIKRLMNDTQEHFNMQAGETIRQSMNNLQPKFDRYKDAIAADAKYIRESADNMETIAKTLNSNASQYDESTKSL